MTEQRLEAKRAPGIVIFVAVLNFIGSFLMFLFSVLCVALLVLGNAAVFFDAVTKRIGQVSSPYHVSIGLNVLLGFGLVVGIVLIVFYILIGIGLLKGKKLAWYFQIAVSALCLLGFPLATAINAVILIFFFRQNVRTYFKV